VTDLPAGPVFVPGRLGVRARHVDGELVLDVHPQPGVQHHGVTRASVLTFAVDALSGLLMDGDPDLWTFTTDLTLRMRAVPSPEVVTATHTVLREGRRSVTCAVELTAEGRHVASSSIGFARVPVRPGDPPKPVVPPELAPEIFSGLPMLSAPLRPEAGVVALEPPGVVEMAVTPDVVNPAGTLQGAMVALAVEAAAEDFEAARSGTDVVVVDLDVRFLAPARVGPVRSSVRALGESPFGPVEVRLHDLSDGHLATLAYARAVRAPHGSNPPEGPRRGIS